ncbi:hypothetical protein [Effusibacillus consociatus]|uniref:DUF5590 domain-containing protein n=1 Tax=Effusibacillus consociatus TaxID=1117041 RepID=A0ABV9Q471_9BACL
MKKIVWTSLLVVVTLIFGSLFLLRELTAAQMPDLKTAARIAVNNSALQRIDSAQPYTGGPFCYVLTGQDKLGRAMMVFATKDKVLGSEYLDKGLSAADAEQKARQASGYSEINTVTPGIIDPNDKNSFAGKASGRFVWEIYGINAQGQKLYTYLDFYNGNVLSSYTLQQTK